MRRDGRGFEDWRVWRPRGGAGGMSFICTADSQSPDTGTGTGQSGRVEILWQIAAQSIWSAEECF